MKNEDKIKLVIDQFSKDTDPVFLDGFKQGMIFVMEANQALAKK